MWKPQPPLRTFRRTQHTDPPNRTVGGWNHAPPGMYETIKTGAGFQPSTVSHPIPSIDCLEDVWGIVRFETLKQDLNWPLPYCRQHNNINIMMLGHFAVSICISTCWTHYSFAWPIPYSSISNKFIPTGEPFNNLLKLIAKTSIQIVPFVILLMVQKSQATTWYLF